MIMTLKTIAIFRINPDNATPLQSGMFSSSSSAFASPACVRMDPIRADVLYDFTQLWHAITQAIPPKMDSMNP